MSSTIIDISSKMMTVKEFIKANNIDIAELYIDKFWHAIEDDKWMYIGADTLEYIGYDPTSAYKPKVRYLTLIKNNFESDQDYKHLTASEAKEFFYKESPTKEVPSDFNPHNKTKHLFVSPDCFKESLLHLQTAKSSELRKYYVKLEKVFKQYSKYQNEYQAKQLEYERKKNTSLIANTIDHNLLLKKEYVYIATTAYYASQNNFKIGKTLDPKQRLSTYNTSHNKNEPYYYAFLSEPTYCGKSIEYVIRHLLAKFRNSDTNELYVVSYPFLESVVKKVCDNYDQCVEHYNECIGNLSLTPVIPVDIWHVEPAPSQSNQPMINGKEAKLLYCGDNPEYPYLRFKGDCGKTRFRCQRCFLEYNNITSIQHHFQRQVKCFDTSKEDHVANVKANEETPTMKYYLDNQEFPYYETFSEEYQRIEYHCNRCQYATIRMRSLRSHFERKFRCFDAPKGDNNIVKIEILYNDPRQTFYQFHDNHGVRMFQCNHCEYATCEVANLRRHFKKPKACWRFTGPIKPFVMDG